MSAKLRRMPAGRPKGPPSTRIVVRIRVSELKRWKRAAKQARQALAKYIRESIELRIGPPQDRT